MAEETRELTIQQVREMLTIPTGFAALSKSQRKEHRRKIGLRVKAVLSQFWVHDGTSDAVQILELEGWLDVIQGLSEQRFRDVWAEYQKSGQRTKGGRLYKPDGGAFYLISKSMDPKIVIIQDEADDAETQEPSPAAKKRMAKVFSDFKSRHSMNPKKQPDFKVDRGKETGRIKPDGDNSSG